MRSKYELILCDLLLKHLLLKNYNFNLFILLHAFDNENVQ